MNTYRRNTPIRIAAALLLILGAVGYALADRYLIQHVEIAGVSASVSAMAEETTLQPTQTSSPLSTSGAEAAEEDPGAAQAVTADDWNYQSDTVSISVREVTTGSGSDTVTYFVADVVLSGAQQLQNAFADDSFGRNIVAYTSEIAEANDAIFAINGDYYGFRTDGIVIRNGVIYRDIPARTGLVFYKDGTMAIYAETQTSAQELLDAGAWNTLSFGPGLIQDGSVVSNLGRVEVDTNIGNHPIQGNQPRTGVGMIDENHFVFIVVDGRSKGYSRGVSLEEFAQIFADLGCTEAYNLDGGGSSTMYFMGRVVNNPLGKGKERGTSDILFVS